MGPIQKVFLDSLVFSVFKKQQLIISCSDKSSLYVKPFGKENGTRFRCVIEFIDSYLLANHLMFELGEQDQLTYEVDNVIKKNLNIKNIKYLLS